MGKKDEFDFDGEMFPMDDFDMGFETKPPKGIKAVFKGIKNIGKWYVSGTLNDYFPETKQLFAFPKEVFDETMGVVRDLNDKYGFKNLIRTKVTDAKNVVKKELNSLKDDIKTGAFITVSSEERMMQEMFSDTSDMFSSSPNDSSEDRAEKRSKRAARASLKGSAAVMGEINKTSVKEREQSARQFEADVKLKTAMHAEKVGLSSNIAQNVARLVKQQNMMIKAQYEFATKELKMQQITAKLLTDIRNAQWKAMGGKKPVDITTKKKITALDIFGRSGDEFNSSNYIAYMGQQIKTAIEDSMPFMMISSLAGMKDMVGMAGGYTGLIKSALGDWMRKKLNNSIFSEANRALFKRIERTSKNFFPALNQRFKDISERGLQIPKTITGNKKIDDKIKAVMEKARSPIEAIARFLIVRDGSSYSSPVSKKDYMKNPTEVHPFDNQAHFAITKIIPDLLSKIYAATSGKQEVVFDYETNGFVEVGKIRKSIKRNEENFIQTAGGNSTIRRFKERGYQDAQKLIEKSAKITNKERSKNDMPKIYNHVVHNYMMYGRRFTPKYYEEIMKGLDMPYGDRPYAFTMLTDGIKGKQEDIDIAIESLFTTLHDMYVKNDLNSLASLDNASITYKNRLKETRNEFQDRLSSSTNTGNFVYSAHFGAGAEEAELRKELDDIIKRNSKDSTRGTAEKAGENFFGKKVSDKFMKIASDKDRKRIEEIQQRLRYLRDFGGTAPIQGFELSTITGLDDYKMSRMKDIDSTNGLIKNIHDMLLEGIVVHNLPFTKEDAQKRRSRLQSFSENANRLAQDALDEAKREEEAKKRDAEYIERMRGTTFDDKHGDEWDSIVDPLGRLGYFLRQPGTNRAKIVDKFDNFVGNVGTGLQKTLLTIMGYKPGDEFYEKATNTKYTTTKKDTKSPEEIKKNVFNSLRDLGIVPEGILKRVETMTDTVMGKANDIYGDVTGKMADVANNFDKKLNSIDMSGTKSALKQAQEEAKKMTEEIVRKAEDKKKKVAEEIIKSAESSGMDPNSEQVKEAIQDATEKIDQEMVSDVREIAGKKVADEVKQNARRFRLLREHKYILTGSIASLIGGSKDTVTGGVTGIIGGAFSAYGNVLGKIGSGARKAGKTIRDIGKDYGIVGKGIGLVLGGGLSAVGAIGSGFGLLNRAKGAAISGMGRLASHTIRGVGKAVGGVVDIATSPVRGLWAGAHSIASAVHNKYEGGELNRAIRRLSKGKASDVDLELINETFKTTKDPALKAKIKAARNDALTVEMKRQDKYGDKYEEKMKKYNAKINKKAEAREDKRHAKKARLEQNKTLMGYLFGKAGSGISIYRDKVDERPQRVGTDEKGEPVYETEEERIERVETQKKEIADKKAAKEAERKRKKEKRQRNRRNRRNRLLYGKNAVLEMDESDDQSKEGSEDKQEDKGLMSKVKEAASNFIFGSHREGSAADQEKDRLEREKLEREIKMAENIQLMVDFMTDKKKGGVLVRFSKEGLRDYDDMQEENLENAPGGGGAGGVGAIVGGLVAAKATKGVRGKIKTGIKNSVKRLIFGKDAVKEAAESGTKAALKSGTGGAKGGILGRVFGKKAATEGAEAAAKAGIKAGAGSAAKPGLLKRFLGFIGDVIKKLVKKVGSKFAPKLTSFFSKAIDGLKKQAMNALQPVLMRFATAMGLSASGVGTLIGVAMYLAPVLYNFVKGAARTRSIFGLGAGATIPLGMRLASGCAEAFDAALFGLPGIIQSFIYGDKYKTVAEMFFYEVFGDAATKQGIDGYKKYNEKRAKIYGIDNPDLLIKYENGGNLAFNALTKIANFATLGIGNLDNRRKASILKFSSVRAFEEWESKKYKPLEELRKRVASDYGNIKELDSISPKDPEKTNKYREAFLKVAEGYVRNKGLEWLTNKTTDEEVENKLGKRNAFAAWGKRLLGATVIGKAVEAHNTKKEASQYYKDEKAGNNKDFGPNAPANMVDANGNVVTINEGGTSFEEEVEKAKSIAAENGVDAGRIDDAVKMLQNGSLTNDMGIVRQVLDIASTMTDKKEAKKKIQEIIDAAKNKKSGSQTQEGATTTPGKEVSTTTAQDGQSQTSTGETDKPNHVNVSGTPTKTGSVSVTGTPASTATLKLSSDIVDALDFVKNQYNETVRHNKVTEAMISAMVSMLATIARNNNSGDVKRVLDELATVISSNQ